MNFFAELPPIMERMGDERINTVLRVIAECQERNVTSAPSTIERKTGLKQQVVRNCIDVLQNADLIETIISPYCEGAGGDNGRFGYRVLQKGWERLNYKPFWM